LPSCIVDAEKPPTRQLRNIADVKGPSLFLRPLQFPRPSWGYAKVPQLSTTVSTSVLFAIPLVREDRELTLQNVRNHVGRGTYLTLLPPELHNGLGLSLSASNICSPVHQLIAPGMQILILHSSGRRKQISLAFATINGAPVRAGKSIYKNSKRDCGNVNYKGLKPPQRYSWPQEGWLTKIRSYAYY
jgi:hypothetical protein